MNYNLYNILKSIININILTSLTSLLISRVRSISNSVHLLIEFNEQAKFKSILNK
jgi:hypothetical protein